MMYYILFDKLIYKIENIYYLLYLLKFEQTFKNTPMSRKPLFQLIYKEVYKVDIQILDNAIPNQAYTMNIKDKQ